jgi:hypothetical protein
MHESKGVNAVRISIIPYVLCLALLTACGDGPADPAEALFEGRDFRVEDATATDPRTVRFLLELRVNPPRFAVTTLTIDGELWSSRSATLFCEDWCDLEVFSTPASSFANLGEHRAVVLVVDAENNIAANLTAMFTVN